MRIRFVLLTLAASLAALVPAANANSFSLFCNGTACGTVNITDISGGVAVDVDMTGGFSIQAEAHNGFTLNAPGVTPALSGLVTTPEFGAVSALTDTNVSDGAGHFTFAVEHYGITSGNTSVSGIEFVLTGMSTSSLAPNNKGFEVAVHFCTPNPAGGTTHCGPTTGFTRAIPTSAVPEPSSLLLLGTGLLGLAPVLRRKMFPGRKLMLGT